MLIQPVTARCCWQNKQPVQYMFPPFLCWLVGSLNELLHLNILAENTPISSEQFLTCEEVYRGAKQVPELTESVWEEHSEKKAPFHSQRHFRSADSSDCTSGKFWAICFQQVLESWLKGGKKLYLTGNFTAYLIKPSNWCHDLQTWRIFLSGQTQ